MPNYNGSILYFSGTQEELREQLDGKIFPVGTVLHINETDTDREKIFVITDLKSFSYDNTPYSETVRSATTDDTRALNDRIDNLEEYIHFIKRLDEQQSRINEMQKQIDELTTKCKAMWEYVQINCNTAPRR